MCDFYNFRNLLRYCENRLGITGYGIFICFIDTMCDSNNCRNLLRYCENIFEITCKMKAIYRKGFGFDLIYIFKLFLYKTCCKIQVVLSLYFIKVMCGQKQCRVFKTVIINQDV